MIKNVKEMWNLKVAKHSVQNDGKQKLPGSFTFSGFYDTSSQFLKTRRCELNQIAYTYRKRSKTYDSCDKQSLERVHRGSTATVWIP